MIRKLTLSLALLLVAIAINDDPFMAVLYGIGGLLERWGWA